MGRWVAAEFLVSYRHSPYYWISTNLSNHSNLVNFNTFGFTI
jgi:hypothetical protein